MKWNEIDQSESPVFDIKYHCYKTQDEIVQFRSSKNKQMKSCIEIEIWGFS